MKMLKPEMDIVRFGAEDVIATSGAGPLTHAIIFNDRQIEHSELSTLSASDLKNVTMISDGDDYLGHLWLDDTSATIWSKVDGKSGTYSFVTSYSEEALATYKSGTGLDNADTGWYYYTVKDNAPSWNFCGSN